MNSTKRASMLKMNSNSMMPPRQTPITTEEYTLKRPRLFNDRKTAVKHLSSKDSNTKNPQTYHILNKKLCASLLTYIRASNASLIARVLNLPRELRDTVYSHLWEASSQLGDPSRALLCWWEHFDLLWLLPGVNENDDPCEPNATGLRPPHFVDQALVGREFASEVLKSLKDNVGKDLRGRAGGTTDPVAEVYVLDASLLGFVEKDVLGVGKTMEELCRNLDLGIAFQCDVLEEGGDETPKEEKRMYIAELDEGVDALLSIPYTERIIVHDGSSRRLQVRPRIVTFVIRQESADDLPDSLAPFLKLVSRAYSGLKEKGFTVKIQYHSDEIGLKVNFEADVWTWTDKDWQTNMKDKNVSKVEPEEQDAERVAEVWGYLRDGLFRTKHISL